MAIGDPTIHNTLGLLFNAIFISAALYGVGCLQGWLYFRKYGLGDSWAIKGTVLLVLACDTAQMILLSNMLYTVTITRKCPFLPSGRILVLMGSEDFGDPAALGKMERGLITQCFFAGMIAFAAQHFYCWRIWLLTRSYWITGFISLLSTTSFVLLYVYTIISYGYNTLEELLQISKQIIMVNSLAAATDVLISGTIIILLRGRQKTQFRRTSDMINRLMVFTFNSGLPTSACAILNVITLNVMPKTLAYMFFYLLLGRFYTNSLLVTLNSREYIRHGHEVDSDSEGMSIPMPSTRIIVSSRDLSRAYPDTGNLSHAVSIRIDGLGPSGRNTTARHREGDSKHPDSDSE